VSTWPNWVDLIVIISFIRGCYVGFSRGFFTEILHGIRAVAITALTINYANPVAVWLRPWLFMGPVIGNVLVFWGLFFALFFATRFLIRWICALVKWERLHWFFQGMGLVCGGFRGVWWGGLIIVALCGSGFDYVRQSVEERSVIGPQFLTLSQHVLNEASARFPGFKHRGKQLTPPLRSERKDHGKGR